MHHITLADMAAVVANAGCICFIPAASFSDPERLRREIRKAKDQTDGPVGLNLSMLPNADTAALTTDFVGVGIEEKVGAFETAGRSPEGVVGTIKAAGIPVIHKVPQVKYARHAQLSGVDAVTILGFEGGGFVGTADVGSLVLINKAVRTLSVPVIAGGGFVDGRGLVAALALGAEGVLMGSRFLASKEAPVSSSIKRWMRQATENDTVVLFRSLGTPVRSIKNGAARKIGQMESEGATLEEILSFAGGKMAPNADTSGDPDDLLFSSGQGVGLIEEIDTIGHIVDDIVSEARQVLMRLNALIMRGAMGA
jgi:nitronate monooxygenase